MSTPFTSPAPDSPSGSSNPVSLKSWFTKITDWIVSLSPAGASVYDSGWQTVPLASGISGQLRYRRVGMQVEVQCNVTSAAGFPQGATQINATPLPAEVCPSGNRRGGAGLSGSTTGATGVSATGAVFVIHQSGATRAAADGACIYFLG